MMPRDIIEPGHIKLYKAPVSVVVEVVKVVFGLVMFWILKDWLFTTIYEISGWTFAKEWAQIDFLFWPAVIITGLILTQIVIIWLTKYYEVMPDRVVIKSGLISRTKKSIDIDQFAALEISQGFLGRLLGYGDIVFLFEAITTVVTKKGVVFQAVRKPDILTSIAANYIKEGKPLNRGVTTNKQTSVVSHVASENVTPPEAEAIKSEKALPLGGEKVTAASPEVEVVTAAKPGELGPIQGEIQIS